DSPNQSGDRRQNGPSGDSLALFPKPLQRRVLDTLARYPHIRQQSSSDCGPACLVMAGKYWGKRFSINYVREIANVGRAGASLKSLAKAAETLGFQARPVRASFSRLAEQHNPWIAHWEGMHYVVIYKVQNNRVLVSDPAQGKRWIPKAQFLNSWTGYALLLDPTERLQDSHSQQRNLGSFLRVLSPYRTLALQIVLASVLIQLFGIVTPLFTQIIIDQVVVSQSVNALTVFALGALLFGIGSIFLNATRRYLLDYFSNRIDLTLIAGFISHTLKLPLKFFESRRVGDIITRVQENQKIQRFLIGQVVLAWLNFLTGFIYLGLMFYYNARLTLLVLALIPPLAILTLVATPFMRRVSREVFNASAEQNSSLVEMMTGVSTVKTSAAERELRWRWEDHLTTSLNARFRSQKLANTLQSTGGLIENIGNIALLWYGAFLVIQGDLTIGQLMAFNMMIGKVISPVLDLVNLWDELQEVLISVERLNDVLCAEPEESPGSRMLVLPKLRGQVRLENMTFRYSEDEERNTLENISFDVQPGQTIAIVGRSGSGKSTLVKLLQGLYYPTSGRIWIDGHDIGHISPHSLRSQMGVVPQECFLFSGTIAENISLFADDVPLDVVVDVAKLAEAHGFIQEMPLGYNAKVGERGAALSGGQRQR
ncbi:MAG: peptidase domain-containing ABC transporter, partial [Chroococcales cyanobacterium]